MVPEFVVYNGNYTNTACEEYRCETVWFPIPGAMRLLLSMILCITNPTNMQIRENP